MKYGDWHLPVTVSHESASYGLVEAYLVWHDMSDVVDEAHDFYTCWEGCLSVLGLHVEAFATALVGVVARMGCG